MLIPHNTDAPIYHWPYVTVGLILINTAVAVLSLSMSEDVYKFLMLQYNTINPLQWLTSNFLHAGPLHLIGNMFALWGFGLVVEGKVGPWRFILIYLGLGIVQCCLEQLLGFVFIGQGGSLGASSIIYGLIAIALIWAPKNNMNCVVLLGFASVHSFEIPILTLAAFMMMLEFGVAALSYLFTGGFTLTSEFLHLLGAALGAMVGVAMLKTNQVDCEGWDIFSVLKGDPVKQNELKAVAKFEENLQTRTTDTLDVIRKYLHSNQPGLAKAAHIEAKQFIPGWRLPEPEMAALINGLVERYQWNDAIDVMVEYLRIHSERAITVRVLLARVCLERLNRPLQALKILAKLDYSQVPPVALQEIEKLKAIAIPLAEDDPFEVIHAEW